MRIAFIAQLYPPEGGAAGTRIYEFATRLAKRGHDVAVFAQTPNYPSGRIAPGYPRKLRFKENWEDVDVHRCFAFTASRSSRLRTVASWISYAMAAGWFASFARPCPDIIIGSSPTLFAALTGAMVSRVRRRPFVMDVRDVWPEYMIHSGWLKQGLVTKSLGRIARHCYRRAKRIIVTTEGQREIIEATGVPRDKVLIIPNGANTDLFHPGISPTECVARLVPQDRFVLTYAGYFAESQGLDKVLEAAKIVKEQDEEILFLLAGDGRTRASLEEQAQAMGLQNVIFAGEIPRQEVASLLCASHVGLVPHGSDALTENIPAKMFDVMACGKPVLLASRGEPAVLLERAQAGIVVEPGDAGQIAQAALELKANQEEAGQWGENAHAFVAAHYDREQGTRRLEECLQQLVTTD